MVDTPRATTGLWQRAQVIAIAIYGGLRRKRTIRMSHVAWSVMVFVVYSLALAGLCHADLESIARVNSKVVQNKIRSRTRNCVYFLILSRSPYHIVHDVYVCPCIMQNGECFLASKLRDPVLQAQFALDCASLAPVQDARCWRLD